MRRAIAKRNSRLLLTSPIAGAIVLIMSTPNPKPIFCNLWESLSPEEKLRLAESADTCVAYLSQVAHGHRRAGASLIERLMAADNRITFQMMRVLEAA